MITTPQWYVVKKTHNPQQTNQLAFTHESPLLLDMHVPYVARATLSRQAGGDLSPVSTIDRAVHTHRMWAGRYVLDSSSDQLPSLVSLLPHVQ
ncbi:hypothetical protein BaRGS_00003814 [Batillaria attramentaria]|uniref:Uncharacterized protein n=1 Tax=Batillaria attramentaria TaxID=370345 RepID=A0ABD0LZW2_9CAEN